MAFFRRVRGVRASLPSGSVIGRRSAGRGAAEIISPGDIVRAGSAAAPSPSPGAGGTGHGTDGQVWATVGSAAAWSFLSLLTKVGTITSGIWQGTKIALGYGGTNADLTGTGPGFLKQATLGANVTVAALANADLPDTAVTPASYTNANVTVNQKGVITAASNGSAGTGTVTHTGGALTNHAPIVGAGSADEKALAAMTDGQLMIGHTGADPDLATLTAGNAINITNAAGSITIKVPDTAVTPASYTLASITVDQQGRITAASSGSAGGTGTVTSVAMTVPAELSVSGSPVTTSGTLAVTWASEADNTILSRIAGSSGVPSFNTLTAILDHALGNTNDKFAVRTSGSWTQGMISSYLTAGTNVTLSGTTNVTINSTGASGSPGGSSDFIAPIYAGGPPSIMRAFGEQSVDGAAGTGPVGTGPVGMHTIQWQTPKQKGDFVSFDGARFINSHYNVACKDPSKAVLTFGDPDNQCLFLANVDGTNTRVGIVGFGTGTAGVPSLDMFRADGTSALPTGLLTSDVIFRFTGNGYGATASQQGMRLSGRALEAWTDAASGARFLIETCATGTLTLSTVLEARSDGVIIQGTNTNNNAAAGKIGEYVSSSIAVGSAVALTSATAANITSISLTAGDWDVWGNASFVAGVGTTETDLAGWISSTSATDPGAPNSGAYVSLSASLTTGDKQSFPVGQMRLSLSATTTVYLSAMGSFGVNSLSAYGFIGARRVR